MIVDFEKVFNSKKIFKNKMTNIKINKKFNEFCQRLS